MSRTDKDLPYWYAEYYEPSHHCNEFGLSFWDRHKDKPCDLHELTFKELRKGGYWGNRRTSTCYWVPVHSTFKGNWYDQNPGWWVRMVWTEPERGRIRDTARDVLKDYNANGSEDFEYDIADYRKKRNGGWYW
jgi:hypothetical protein